MKKYCFLALAIALIFTAVACSPDTGIPVEEIKTNPVQFVVTDRSSSTDLNNYIGLKPHDATDKTVTFTVGDFVTGTNLVTPSDYVTISSKGIITVTQTDKCFKFTVKAVSSNNITNDINVYVNMYGPKNVQIAVKDGYWTSGSDIRLFTNTTSTDKIAKILTTVTDTNYIGGFNYVSDNEDVVTTNESGDIIAMGYGSTTVTVTAKYAPKDKAAFSKVYNVTVNEITTATELQKFLSDTDCYKGVNEAYLSSNLTLKESVDVSKSSAILHLNGNNILFDKTENAFNFAEKDISLRIIANKKEIIKLIESTYTDVKLFNTNAKSTVELLNGSYLVSNCSNTVNVFGTAKKILISNTDITLMSNKKSSFNNSDATFDIIGCQFLIGNSATEEAYGFTINKDSSIKGSSFTLISKSKATAIILCDKKEKEATLKLDEDYVNKTSISVYSVEATAISVGEKGTLLAYNGLKAQVYGSEMAYGISSKGLINSDKSIDINVNDRYIKDYSFKEAYGIYSEKGTTDAKDGLNIAVNGKKAYGILSKGTINNYKSLKLNVNKSSVGITTYEDAYGICLDKGTLNVLNTSDSGVEKFTGNVNVNAGESMAYILAANKEPAPKGPKEDEANAKMNVCCTAHIDFVANGNETETAFNQDLITNSINGQDVSGYLTITQKTSDEVKVVFDNENSNVITKSIN